MCYFLNRFCPHPRNIQMRINSQQGWLWALDLNKIILGYGKNKFKIRNVYHSNYIQNIIQNNPQKPILPWTQCEEIHQPSANTRLNDSLNLIVESVRKVRD